MILTYNQNGSSRGVANIIFNKPETAAKAAKDLNGLLVDGKPMKVSEVTVLLFAPPATRPLGVGIFFTPSAPLFLFFFFFFPLGFSAKTRGRSK